jgi:hypothetical protein
MKLRQAEFKGNSNRMRNFKKMVIECGIRLINVSKMFILTRGRNFFFKFSSMGRDVTMCYEA